MPYLILIIGLLVGLYALYRFFISASIPQIKAMFLTGLLVVLGIAVFVLALTGRFPVALAILVAAVPIGLNIRKSMREHQKEGDIILSDKDVEVISEDNNSDSNSGDDSADRS